MLSVAVLAWAAAKSPSLRIGPVTATIVILSGGPHGGMVYAAERVGEIVLGSLVGLAATLFVIPARARRAAVDRAGVLLGQLQAAYRLYADALDKGEPPAETAALNAQIRASLTALETVMAEVTREARAHLAPDDLSEALPRTLWRVRNDAVVIGRTLSRPFSAEIRTALGARAQALLEAAYSELGACRNALAEGTPTPPSPIPAAAEAFRLAFAELRSSGLMRGLGFEEIGHVFGLAWAFEAMERNLADLADRVDESIPRRMRGGISPLGPGVRRPRVESSRPLGQGTADGELGGR
jgi:uncharacterized membrane protein YccC